MKFSDIFRSDRKTVQNIIVRLFIADANSKGVLPTKKKGKETSRDEEATAVEQEEDKSSTKDASEECVFAKAPVSIQVSLKSFNYTYT